MVAPLVSVIVTAHNTGAYLDECLKSITASNHTDLDIVVVNDGSTDDTALTMDTWANRDDRVRPHHTSHRGRRAALQLAHQQALGSLHCWVDSDDRIHPTAIARSIDAIDTDHQLVYTHRQLIDTDGTALGPDKRNRRPYSSRQLLVDNMIFHLRTFTVELFEHSGGIGNLESAIDWDMNLRMAEHTTPRCVPRVLYDYRIRPNRMAERPDQLTNGATAVRNALTRRQLPYQLRIDHTGWHLIKPPTRRTR